MSAAQAGPDPPADDPVITLHRPACLQRRAPRRIFVSVGAGQCPRVTGRGVRLTAGQTVRIRVFPPAGEPGRGPAAVEVTPDSALQPVIGLTRVGEGEVRYHAEFRAQLHSTIPEFIRNKVPLPCRGELVVAIKDERFDPLKVTLPFVIWPSLRTLLVSGLLTVTLAFVVPQLMNRVGSDRDLGAAAWGLATDSQFWFRTAALTVAATFALHLLGSLLVFTGLVGEDG